MANTPVDPTASLPALTIKDGSGATLDKVTPASTPTRIFKRNRKAFQAYQSDNANASGDGRIITDERTIDILIFPTSSKTAWQRLEEIEDHLNSAASLDLDGITISISGSTGIQSAQPLTGDDSGTLKATLGYIPTTPKSSDGTNDLLGPL